MMSEVDFEEIADELPKLNKVPIDSIKETLENSEGMGTLVN